MKTSFSLSIKHPKDSYKKSARLPFKKSDYTLNIKKDLNPDNEEGYFNKFVQAIKKKGKTLSDVEIIAHFLTNLPNFLELVHKDNASPYNEDVFFISFHINYQKFEENSVVFHFGNRGNHFYIILKGSITILIPKRVKYRLTLNQYYKYLNNLKLLGEDELMRNCINMNSSEHIIDPAFFVRKDRIKKSLDFCTLTRIKNFEVSNFEDYIKIANPCVNSNLEVNESKYTFKLYEFSIDSTLTEGHYFGQNDLEQRSCKRNSTVFVNKESHFGLLEKEIYNKTIKIEEEKQRKININLFLRTQFFQGIDHFQFQTYFNKFLLKNIKIGEYIFEENSDSNFVYFIKNGEFEVTFNKSLKEVQDIIHTLNQKTAFDSEIPFYSQKIIKFLNEKEKTRFSIIKSEEYIGLDDMFLKEKSIFSVKCLSSTSEIFRIDKHMFKKISEKEKTFEKSIEIFVKNKIKSMLERLISLFEAKVRIILLKNQKESRHSLEVENGRVINSFNPPKKKPPRIICNSQNLSRLIFSSDNFCTSTKSDSHNFSSSLDHFNLTQNVCKEKSIEIKSPNISKTIRKELMKKCLNDFNQKKSFEEFEELNKFRSSIRISLDKIRVNEKESYKLTQIKKNNESKTERSNLISLSNSREENNFEKKMNSCFSFNLQSNKNFINSAEKLYIKEFRIEKKMTSKEKHLEKMFNINMNSRKFSKDSTMIKEKDTRNKRKYNSISKSKLNLQVIGLKCK